VNLPNSGVILHMMFDVMVFSVNLMETIMKE